MERSDSDKLKPPSVQGAFARRRKEKAEREGTPTWVEPYAAPTPAPPRQEPAPADEVVPDVAETPATEQRAVPAQPVTQPAPVAEPQPGAEPEAAEAAELEVEPIHEPPVSETAVLAHVSEKPETPAKLRRTPKQKAPKEPKEPKATTPRAPKPAKEAKAPRAPKAPKTPRTPKVARAPHRRHVPAVIPILISGGCAGGVLMGLVAVFNRWGGQADSINALELLGSFLAAIVVGFALLAIGRIGHRAAISFLGVGLVAVVLMFFPSDRWQTVTGGIIVVIATAVAYVAAHMVAREATSER